MSANLRNNYLKHLGWIMKTFRIQSNIVNKIACFHVLFLTGIVLGTVNTHKECFASPTVFAPVQNSTKQNGTPDPYFNAPTESSSSYAMANQLGGKQKQAATGGWDAPLTPVSSTKTAIPFQPNLNKLTPLTSTPGSRVQATPTNANFNGFGSTSPSKENTSIIRQPSTGFSVTDAGSNSNDFVLDNSFTFKGSQLNKPSSSRSTIQTPSRSSTSSSTVNNQFAANNSSSSFASVGYTEKSSPNGIGQASSDHNQKDNSVRTASANIPTGREAVLSNSEEFEPGKILAIVGGEPILVGDVVFEINQRLEQAMPTAPQEIKARERRRAIPLILPQFVQAKLRYMGTVRQLPEGADIEGVLGQAAKEFDENALEKIMKGAGIKSVAEFDAHLRAQGSSLRKLRRSWSEDQLTRFFLAKQINFNGDVTHQEMLDDYRENLASYATPAKCRWEQVMVRFDKADSKQAAKATIVELGDQIVYGANLGAVAKKSSHGYRAFEGGNHDWTTKGALVLKKLDESLFSLPIGKLSDIIETTDGFHIVRVLERNEATHTSFLEAQVKIKERILGERRDAAFKVYMDKLKAEIPVEYFIGSTMDPLSMTR